MSAAKILLVLGAGPNIGGAVAKYFAAQGYQVAVTSRGGKLTDESFHSIKADLAQPSSVKGVFEAVQEKFGSPPNVVVYNAAFAYLTPSHPLELSQQQLEETLAVNITSPYLAAQEATKGWASLPADTPKSFIYTGNGLNSGRMPVLTSLGVGKSGFAHVLENAAASYEGEGYTFYYGDERKPDGAFAYKDIDGPAHAKYYWGLSQDRTQGAVISTFVKGEGYKRF